MRILSVHLGRLEAGELYKHCTGLMIDAMELGSNECGRSQLTFATSSLLKIFIRSSCVGFLRPTTGVWLT